MDFSSIVIIEFMNVITSQLEISHVYSLDEGRYIDIKHN